ncbi:MAG: Dihydroneopterin aldolase, partial [uncultured Ramlibacter sp.]
GPARHPDPHADRTALRRQPGHPRPREGGAATDPRGRRAQPGPAAAAPARRRHPARAGLPQGAPDHHRRVHGRAREPAGEPDRQAGTAPDAVARRAGGAGADRQARDLRRLRGRDPGGDGAVV